MSLSLDFRSLSILFFVLNSRTNSLLWAPRVEKGVVQKEISHVHLLACLSITGVMSTTPLEVLLSLPPCS